MKPFTMKIAVPRGARLRTAGLGLALTLAMLPVVAQAPLDIRVALVIGNSAYPGAPLANPVNDARAMGETLRGLGFSVIELRDGGKAQMDQAITRLREALKGKQAVGMLYYAGHGLQVDWRNYMVPVDAHLGSAADVLAQTIDLNSVIEVFKASGDRMNILVLDACRDNPFGSTASGKGLAQLDAPPGTFLAYATAPGNVAEDGDEKKGNGLYTQYLLEELKKPSAKIEDVFKRVRLNVRQASQGRQIPWESTSLEDDFYFRPGNAPKATPDENAFAREGGIWEKSKQANSAEAYIDYLRQYPSGMFSEIAQSRLDRLQKPIVTPKFKEGDALANDTTTERFRVGDSYEYQIKGVGPRSGGDSTTRMRVTAIKDDVVEVNGGGRTFDRLGNIQSRRDKVWEDAQFFPAQYQPGKRWSLRVQLETDARDDTVSMQARISARERIKVPAGEFDVYRVDVSGVGLQGHRYDWTFWMNPNYGLPIKSVEERRNPRGRLGRSETWELTALRAMRQ
jgi:uncharacterized caspase-like protein